MSAALSSSLLSSLAAVFAFGTLFSQFYLRRQAKILEHEARMRELDARSMIERMQIEFRTIEDREHVASRYLSKIISELPQTIVSRVIESWPPSDARIIGSGSVVSSVDQGLTVREISHALNTPLAQIETAALLLKENAGDPEVRDASIRDVLEAAELCKTFIGGFRQVASVVGPLGWESRSLVKTLDSGCRMYMRKSLKDASISMDLPDSVEGYSNSYILSVLLPLVENAVESNVGGGEISVKLLRLEENVLRFEVINTPELLPIGDDDIYRPGFTTKDGAHEGLGLSSVKVMVSAHRDGKIGHRIDGEKVTFFVLLPGGGSND
ncbi:hypothetical protein PV646_42260 [Streptomyces sp. ID05-26A]|nr:hypothetical protein [Streptomyces sp. ID05-26A]